MVTNLSPSMAACFILITFHEVLANQEKSECVIEGMVYKQGESWPFDENGCTLCTCGKGGKITCHREECPIMQCEKSEILPGQCCATCLDNLPPVVAPSPPPGGPCIHADILRQNGEFFPSTDSGLKPTSTNQCVLCYCMDTDVLCHLKTCPKTTCLHPVLRENDCCTSCPADGHGEDSGAIVEIKVISSTQPPRPSYPRQTTIQNPDCHFGGKVYENGTRWHPVVAMFGRMDCVICQCENASITCGRITCQPQPPCVNPVTVRGHCCKSCPLQEGLESNSSSEREAEKAAVKMKLWRRRGEGSAGGLSPPGRPCPGRTTDVLVYSSHTRTVYILIFYQRGTAEKLSWTMDSGQIRSYELSKNVNESFQQLPNYKLLGRTKIKRSLRFKQRMKRLMDKCGLACPRKILNRQIRRLRLKSVNYDPTC